MSTDSEKAAKRVREAYARRSRLGLDARYEYWRPANLFTYQSRERGLARLLDREGFLPIGRRSVLDVGCGDGGVLRDLLRFGAAPECLTGIDLLEDRVARASELTPGARIEAGDAQALPFADGAFDLVLGFTLLSSIKEADARRRVAAEMARVCAPAGAIVLYDFWVNPFNRDVRPLRRKEVRSLFPTCKATFRAVTLAPPVVRALAPLPGGWIACHLLEVLPFLRTHFLVALRPPAAPAPAGAAAEGSRGPQASP